MTDPTPQAKPTPAPAVPEALLAQWREDDCRLYSTWLERLNALAQIAANWAWHQRDEEVRAAADAGYAEACAAVADYGYVGLADKLRDERHPAPPTLRERAIAALRKRLNDLGVYPNLTADIKAMELALHALQEGADG